MRLPRGLGELRLGVIPAAPVETAVGTVRVEARGIVFASRWGGLRWLRPARVRLTRPDGREYEAPVRDRSGRATLALGLAALAVLLGTRRIERKWGQQ